MSLVTSVTRWTELLWDRHLPQLTWYSSQRIELNGPVLSRWLAKASNFFSEEFPFGIQTLGHCLPLTWQMVPWIASAWLQGVPTLELNDSPNEDAGSLGALLSNSIPLLEWAARESIVPLALSPEPMGLGWPTDLPQGAEDASASLLGQPDSVVEQIDVSLTSPLFAGSPLPTVSSLLENPLGFKEGQRVLIAPRSNTELTLVTLQAINCGAAVVVATNEEAKKLALRQERIDLEI